VPTSNGKLPSFIPPVFSNRQPTRIIGVVAMALFAIAPSHAGIYKWTDSEGNVHFGDRPVDESSATELDINTDKAGITHSSGNTEARQLMLKTIDADRKIEAKRNKELARMQAKRQKKCQHYQDKYQQHQRSTHTYRKSADGEYQFYSNDGHDALRARLKANVDKYCR
jgi:hypothetical protein